MTHVPRRPQSELGAHFEALVWPQIMAAGTSTRIDPSRRATVKMPDKYTTIYLTGAPATGKSTLTLAMAAMGGSLAVLEYGALMTKHLAGTHPNLIQETLRSGVANLISTADVHAVNHGLVEAVRDPGRTRCIVIDSHQVTAEEFGLQVIPFELEVLRSLELTEIWLAVASPETLDERLQSSRQGRRPQSAFLSALHQGMQASIAVHYACTLGIPLQVIEMNKSPQQLAESLLTKLDLGITPPGES